MGNSSFFHKHKTISINAIVLEILSCKVGNRQWHLWTKLEMVSSSIGCCSALCGLSLSRTMKYGPWLRSCVLTRKFPSSLRACRGSRHRIIPSFCQPPNLLWLGWTISVYTCTLNSSIGHIINWYGFLEIETCG
jgi:hypothetical protein